MLNLLDLLVHNQSFISTTGAHLFIVFLQECTNILHPLYLKRTISIRFTRGVAWGRDEQLKLSSSMLMGIQVTS